MLSRFRIGLACAAIFLAALSPSRALDIQFDYTYDTGNFFVGHADRQSVLNAAAAVFELRFTDTLAAITPSGALTWSADFDNPSTGTAVSVNNLSLGQGVLKVYVGAMQLGSGTLGIGGPGGYHVGGSGTAEEVMAWGDTVVARGQAGALAATPTDFGPWGGAITFDVDGNWYFGTGSLAGKDDFLSVATHELGHLLGFGTADSWLALEVRSKFTGTHATAANGGIQAGISGDGHWAAGTMSTVFGASSAQEVAMDPSITVGTQKYFTTLDFAGMQDIGWTLVPEPTAPSLFAVALALAGFIRQRKT
ncbi:MAG: matrixin family metalloprotease [Chthoniobacteraceae bacterium]